MAGEKRVQDQEETLLTEKVILIDIEGTTTSISFVKETLFPYVRENLTWYIETKWEDEEFKKDLEKLKEQAKKDEEDKVEGFVPLTGGTPEEERKSLVKNITWQMDCDRKTGALKQLQGHIWRDAYNSGSIKGHVYDDVPKALETWSNDGRKIYVYSSGSVEAQKLLFGHSVHGDLLKYFSGFFDTEVGAKQEPDSYKNILSKISAEPSNALFLTDVVKEAKAAKEAGLSTIIVVREGNTPLTAEESVAFNTVKSLLDLSFQSTAKRQKLAESEPEEKDKASSSVNEPMDTSEDVEMSDVSEKKSEQVEMKENTESEQEETSKSQNQDKTEASTVADEPMITDAKDTRAEKIEGTTEEKSSAVSTESKPSAEASENVQNATSSEKTAVSASPAVEKETEKSVVPEKIVEEPAAKTAQDGNKNVSAETNSVAGDAMDVSTPEPKSKLEEKTEEGTQVTNDTKSETSSTSDSTVKNVETNASVSKDKDNEKETAVECPKVETEKIKAEESCAKVNSSTIERTKSANEEVSKVAQESTKSDDTPSADTSKNGDVTETVESKEKDTTLTIKKEETTDNKQETKEESKPVAETTEKKLEVETESKDQSDESKATNVTPKEDAIAADTIVEKDKTEETVETKQEGSKEIPKAETPVEETKDKTTVDNEQQKLNGTAQNGETELAVSDEKLHRNGLKEDTAKEKLVASSTEDTAAQNGEPESSSEASAESIKVKKVVDSSVADGAGEPDVVPPVVVAATS